VKTIKELIEQAKMNHATCEDSWYSCAVSSDYTGQQESDRVQCTCGADRVNHSLDEINNRLDEILDILEKSAYCDFHLIASLVGAEDRPLDNRQ